MATIKTEADLQKINILTKDALDNLDTTQLPNQIFGTTDENDSWGGVLQIDSFLSTTSINPVQNKVIANAINQMNDKINELLESMPKDILNGEDCILLEGKKISGKSTGGDFNGISNRPFQYYDNYIETNLLDLLSNKNSGIYSCVLDFKSHYINASTGAIANTITTTKVVDFEYIKNETTPIIIKTKDIFTVKNGSENVQYCGISIEINTNKELSLYAYFPSGTTLNSNSLVTNGFTVKLRDLVI